MAALALVLLAPACGAVSTALGPTPAEARSALHDVMGAIRSRFGPTDRDPAFETLRAKLGRAALVPSRMFNDTSAWTHMKDAERVVELSGRREAGAHRLRVEAAAPLPREAGAYRGRIRLAHLEEVDDYTWTVREDLGIGRATPAALARAHDALLRLPDGLPGGDAREAVREALPRTTAALGRLFTLETLAVDRGTSSLVTIVARMTPEGLEKEKPRYARFLTRYVGPMRLHAEAVDAVPRRWWTLDVAGSRLTLVFRVRDGRLAPLDAADALLPDTFTVRSDYATRMGPFDVGLRNLVADVQLTRTAAEKSFRARFTRQPDWDLPFFVGPFVKGSLRRPFRDEGSWLRFAVEGGESHRLVRDFELTVRESWIVRWLGGMTQGALETFRRGAEAEAEAYVAEVATALQADLDHALPGPAPPAR